MKIKEFQPKINVFGIGGCGNEIVHKIKADARLSKILINTDVSHLYATRSLTTAVDAAILCGKNTCKGLGCSGKRSIGYNAAKETFSNIMSLFDNNQINLFVCGLGAGAGEGITEYILKELCEHHHHCNIVLCTFPFNLERMRVKTAPITLKAISEYCDLVILIDMNAIVLGLAKKMSVQQSFTFVNKLIREYITDLSKLKNKKIIEDVMRYKKKSKIIRIKSVSDLRNYFFIGVMQ